MKSAGVLVCWCVGVWGFLTPFISRADTLVPDESFGRNGEKLFSFSPGSDRGEAVVVDSLGRVLLGVTANYEAKSYWAFVRLKSDGLRDETFGEKGSVLFKLKTPLYLYGLVSLADGSFIAAGTSGKKNKKDLIVAKFLASGDIDLNYAVNGQWIYDLGADDEIHYAVQGREGHLYFSGFSKNKGGSRAFVGALKANGELNSRFGEQGFSFLNHSTRDYFFGLTLTDDEKLLAVGSTLNKNNDLDAMAARFTKEGKLDFSFQTGGVEVIRVGEGDDYAAAVSSSKKRVAITGYSEKNKEPYLFFKELGSELYLDKKISNGHALALLPSGNWVVAGETSEASLVLLMNENRIMIELVGKKTDVLIHAMDCSNLVCYLAGNLGEKALLTKINLSSTFNVHGSN